MCKLTTHILDTAHGCPASQVAVSLYHHWDDQRILLKQAITNHDGRLEHPLLDDQRSIGTFEIEFAMGDYFRALNIDLPDPPFLDIVVLRFGTSDAQAHYHIPLLISPWSYSTYRGS